MIVLHTSLVISPHACDDANCGQALPTMQILLYQSWTQAFVSCAPLSCWSTGATLPTHHVIFDRRHAAMPLADNRAVASHEQLSFVFVLRLALPTNSPPNAAPVHTEAIFPVSLHLYVLRAPVVILVTCADCDYERAFTIRSGGVRRIRLAQRWWRGRWWRRRQICVVDKARSPRSHTLNRRGTPFGGVRVDIVCNCIVGRDACWVVHHCNHFWPAFGVDISRWAEKSLVEAIECQRTICLQLPIHTPVIVLQSCATAIDTIPQDTSVPPATEKHCSLTICESCGTPLAPRSH